MTTPIINYAAQTSSNTEHQIQESRWLTASTTITAGQAVTDDVSYASTPKGRAVKPTSAVDQVVVGIAHPDHPTRLAGQLVLVVTDGILNGVSVVTGASAGNLLQSSATAGRLEAAGAATERSPLVCLVDAASNLARVRVLCPG